LHDYLGVRHVIWLGQGIAGDDTDGHVDDIARFVDPTTVVCVVEEDPHDINYEVLQDNYRRLQAATDQHGRALRVIPLPMPGPVGPPSARLPASYANFYIANGVVLVPTYDHPNDQCALMILQQVFPDRRVLGLPCEPLVWGLGAIHCVTQQQPAPTPSGRPAPSGRGAE
jgi:agmatine deiminase